MKTFEQALDDAYLQCGNNAYFGNGFKSGFEFANELIESEVDLPEKFTRVLVKFEPYDKKLFEICVIHEFSDGYKMWLSDSGLYYKIKDTKWKYLNY